ncbi:MAG: NAD(P)/FAD-dependent oxidoreductase [Alphaproteobacteria bacterium]|nr:NAD(P)/FAD-dependent oxidoreductase [Alphaproteobacteria bacterium]
MPSPSQRRPRVVIVGAGFGGLSAAKALAGAPVDVVLVDKRNYHLFQPLLYQVATAGLSPADIAAPIRGIVRRQANVSVVLGKVTGIDPAAREVLTDEARISYDFLVLATGARHAYFGRDEWEPFAPGLKKIDDATAIRRRILMAFERAELEVDAGRRRDLLTFVIVGGGPTGVELAGAIAELARKTLSADFRHIDPRAARVILIEAGPRVLAAFPPSLSEQARRSLERLGVEVRTGHPVDTCDAGGVSVSGERIGSRTILWAAGVAASPAAKWLMADKDRAGRIKVEPDLSVPGHPAVFAIGDTAMVADGNGKPVPGIAPAAKQQGTYVGRIIRNRVAGIETAPFRYRHYGNLATIGRKSAVADFGALRLSGFAAWLLWSVAHIYFLIGFRNRVVVSLNWLWAYLTFQRGARLITGQKG